MTRTSGFGAALKQPRVRRGAMVAAAAVVCGGLGVGVAGWWALRPLTAPAVPAVPAVSAVSERSERPLPGPPGRTPLELRGFGADLWPRTARPMVESAPPSPPPPLRIQLLGITSDGPGRWLAAIYDPDSDRLTEVRAGDRIGPRTVTSVGPDGVRLRAEREPERTVALRLWDPSKAGARP